MAAVVTPKNVKNAAANASSRLVNRPNPFSGNPKTVPPSAPLFCADCVSLRASVEYRLTKYAVSRKHNIKVDATIRTGAPSDRSLSLGWSERRPSKNRTGHGAPGHAVEYKFMLT